jgi:hypothetical protein
MGGDAHWGRITNERGKYETALLVPLRETWQCATWGERISAPLRTCRDMEVDLVQNRLRTRSLQFPGVGALIFTGCAPVVRWRLIDASTPCAALGVEVFTHDLNSLETVGWLAFNARLQPATQGFETGTRRRRY